MNQAALVTGAAKRIGRQIALALAGEGFDIALHYNTSPRDAETTAQEIRALGRRCELFAADLGDSAQVQKLVPAVFDKLPGCNLLVNSASIFQGGKITGTEEPLYDRLFDINLKAPFLLSRDFARRCSSGHIVNLLDTKVAKSSSLYFAYTLTKKALAEFTTMAARELAPAIRVNGVCPGLILPPPGQTQEYLRKLAPSVPLQRVGNPEMIASAVLFLVKNDYITGQFIYVDGGWHLN
jgi:NAD(P)-dependent dehydrogenase (short-subunit alcohol dehydrogenase family)